MIKKIKVNELKPGVFIHDFDASWIRHPFLFGSKKIRDWGTIKKIKNWGIKEVYIDTTKGLDIIKAPSVDELRAAFSADPDIVIEKPEFVKKVSLHQELQKAKIIKKEAKKIIQNLTNDLRLGKQIEVEQVGDVVDTMMESIFRNQDALLNLISIRKKDEYTFMHSVNVSVIMIALCKALKMDQDEIREFGVGAMMHDIGKSKIPIEIINKPGKLTDEEFTLMKRHSEFSRQILEETGGTSKSAVEIAHQHHERFDGTGYPQGLRGKKISLGGRIAAIVDVYDAITSKRSYSSGVEPNEAIKKIFEWSKFHFDEELVHQFIKSMGIYPVGTVVGLESGLLGLVIESGRESMLQPVVRIFYDTNKGIHITPRDLDISQGIGKAHSIKYSEPHNKWDVVELGLMQLK